MPYYRLLVHVYYEALDRSLAIELNSDNSIAAIGNSFVGGKIVGLATKLPMVPLFIFFGRSCP